MQLCKLLQLWNHHGLGNSWVLCISLLLQLWTFRFHVDPTYAFTDMLVLHFFLFFFTPFILFYFLLKNLPLFYSPNYPIVIFPVIGFSVATEWKFSQLNFWTFIHFAKYNSMFFLAILPFHFSVGNRMSIKLFLYLCLLTILETQIIFETLKQKQRFFNVEANF